MLFVRSQYTDKREEVMKRLNDMQGQYEELAKHRDEVNQALKILETEFNRMEGELRILEELANKERELAQKANSKANGEVA